MTAILTDGLCKDYGSHRALNDFTVSIPEGQFVTLLGPSGSGKTTALRCFAGLEQPTDGVIELSNETVAAPRRNIFVPPDKRRVGFVFQSYALWPHLTVAGNVGYPLWIKRTPKNELKERVRELLRIVGLEQFADRPSSQLSGGQQQRVALARALANGSSFMLYDEPLSNLDAQLRATTRDQIRDVHERMGTTSIYVTHDQDEALKLSDRIIVMSDGLIEQDAPPEEVYHHPATLFVARFVGFDNVLQGTVISRDGSSATVRLEGGLGDIEVEADSLQPDQVVDLAIRPTDLRAGHDIREAEGNVVTARIGRIAFAGDRWELRLEGPGGIVLSANVATSSLSSPHNGDTISIQLPSDRIRAFARGQRTAEKEGAIA